MFSFFHNQRFIKDQRKLKQEKIYRHVKPVIRSQKEGLELIKQGWSAADLHVHSWCSYDVAPVSENNPLTLYKKALQAGMTFVTFTNHDTMDAYDQIGWTRARIVPGVEIKILDHERVGHTIHVNVYQLDRKIFRELQEIAEKSKNIELFISYLNSHNLHYIYNHPFWHEPNEILNITAVLNLIPLFPILEYNMGRVNPLNLHAAYMARRSGAGLAASTDTHSGQIAQAFTLASGDSFEEFMAEIRAGRSYLVPKDLTTQRLTDEVLERVKCIFNRELWQFEKPDYSLETGISRLDAKIQKIIHGRKEENSHQKKILQWMMKAIALSKIPASIYIRSQKLLAESVLRMIPA